MMIGAPRDRFSAGHLWIWAVIAAVLLGAAVLGFHPSPIGLALLVAGIGTVVLLRRTVLGLMALVIAALVVPLELGTGTAVAINPAVILIPTLLGFWVLDMLRRGELRLVPSRINRPLLLFLLIGLISLLVGNVLWDPQVPRSNDFTIVQLAQWAVFVFSAVALWLTGNLVRDEVWLRRITFTYLAVAGCLAILRVLPGTAPFAARVATLALDRAPFWMLLTALAGGQMLFNRELAGGWRLFLLAVLVAVLIYAFDLERATASNWVGVTVVAGVLAWLRFPLLRWPVLIVLLVAVGTGLLSSAVYDFAGGDAEWVESGGSRLVLIRYVVEATMSNPITGLGPAAYRPYTWVRPLQYQGAFWPHPLVSSHNNYVDLFAHTGLLGLGLFLWFAAEMTRLGFRLRVRVSNSFATAYVSAMLAAWAGALALMLLADWILPFVYNIGFSGFQASVLVWLFLGGLVALEQMADRESIA